MLKLLWRYTQRYKLVAAEIGQKDIVLDLCAGPGDLRKFLPKDCIYVAVDKSVGFQKHVKNNAQVTSYNYDLSHGIPDEITIQPDVITMIISLCSFKEDVIHKLLQQMKAMTKAKVVLLEEYILEDCNSTNGSWYLKFIQSLGKKVTNYLCGVDENSRFALLTKPQLINIFTAHGFNVSEHPGGYLLAVYRKESKGQSII